MQAFAEKFLLPLVVAVITAVVTAWAVSQWGPPEAAAPPADAPKIVVTQRAVEVPVLAADLAQDELLAWLKANQPKKKPLAQIYPPEVLEKNKARSGQFTAPSAGGDDNDQSGSSDRASGGDGMFSALDWMAKRRYEPLNGYVISQLEIKNAGTAIYRDITVPLTDWLFVTAKYQGNFSVVTDRPAKYTLNPNESVLITGLIDGMIQADGSLHMRGGQPIVAHGDTPIPIDLLRPTVRSPDPNLFSINTENLHWYSVVWIAYVLVAIVVGSFTITLLIMNLWRPIGRPPEN